jgi:sulfopyruvate decarboxylase, alpha subunit
MNPEEYILNVMREEGIEYVTTLPCEKIKNLLNLLSSHFNEIKLTREECGLGICSGIYLAGGRGAMVIQSTGIGNSMNAITSLCKTYDIAIPILASWRGVYEESIPAQVPLGRALPKILDATEIPYETIEEKKED